ncbi:glycosyltransferase family 2 protein [Propionicicella superfundia]|uniref:glycosyltransferase family 2 protein n=1 Tax=Propionicicella superfundia TaxID=348582 RepID=UPI0012EC7ABB|nr:glycosyltransferase family 2 protein [Propionicicella superfundia]
MGTGLISYVFPIYNESGNIALLHQTMSEVVKPLAYDVEFVFVNDGSRDDSLELLIELTRSDPRCRVIDLSRNFGHQLAVTAGVDAARGDAIIIMDSDMQDPPEVSLELIAKWEEGYDVAYAQRRSRQDTAFKKLTADLFYRTLNALSEIEIPRNTGDFRLISRRAADQLAQYREHDRFLRGMISHAGYKQIAVPFDRHARHAGETGYPLRKMLRFAADGIMGFSSKPLQLITRVGYVFSVLALLGILYVLFVRIFFPEVAVAGWAFTVIVILLVGGLQLVMMGIIGSYVGRIYTEVKNRPLYGVQETYGFSAGPGVAGVPTAVEVTASPGTDESEGAATTA